jgi:hypothetical protein
MTNLVAIFRILMKSLFEILVSLKSIFPTFINSTRSKTTYKNISQSFNTQIQRRNFSTTPILNKYIDRDSEEG